MSEKEEEASTRRWPGSLPPAPQQQAGDRRRAVRQASMTGSLMQQQRSAGRQQTHSTLAPAAHSAAVWAQRVVVRGEGCHLVPISGPLPPGFFSEFFFFFI
ncbi:hypothetical protein COCNU_06G008970 [Cocos nucifera]|uniref:Uncharacterized protein n=1 Tax=Cocos nucifera TaxID=13894 RepID=A0A8K0IB19_COCNU|nr:hypothetical protein COCNU_06G008970 [Cocos nucifera]